jgi:hypothetical protein
VNDVLSGLDNPKLIMDQLASVYTLKAGTVKEPDIYQGADMKKFEIGIGKAAWGLSSDSYCQTAVKEVERKLVKS